MDYTEQIKAYLEGRLDGPEKQAFEQAMREDDLLRKAVEKFPEIQEVLQEMEARAAIRSARARLRSERIQQDVADQPAKVVPMWSARRMLAAAAGIAVLVVAGLFIYANLQLPNTAIAQQAFFVPRDPSPDQGGPDDTVAIYPLFEEDTDLRNVPLAAYGWQTGFRLVDTLRQLGRLDEANILAGRLLDGDPGSQVFAGYGDNTLLILRIAHFYFRTGQHVAASEALMRAVDDEVFGDHARFNLAINRLEAGSVDAAKDLLQELTEQANPVIRDKSKEVLSRLDSPLRSLLLDRNSSGEQQE
ncbi:MAG: hypothetical protein R3301_19060 [Saprospiraceae bacterium]|nr:hypothetical protein [Saprospiraceae bacterium]